MTGKHSVFDEATAARPAGTGRYQVHPDVRFAMVVPGGSTPAAVNGGVMVATVLRAVLDTSPHPTRWPPARISCACPGWSPPRSR